MEQLTLSSILAIVIASLLGWTLFSLSNRMLYRRIFTGEPSSGMHVDFIVLLGPIGTICLLMCLGLMLYTKFCYASGKYVAGIHPLLLIPFAILVPWAGCGALNHIWYGHLFNNSGRGMDRDLILALGPIGTFMLFLCFCLMQYDRLIRFLGSSFSNA